MCYKFNRLRGSFGGATSFYTKRTVQLEADTVGGVMPQFDYTIIITRNEYITNKKAELSPPINV